MIAKILFTLAVLAAAFVWLKTRSRPKPQVARDPQPEAVTEEQPGPPKLIAGIVLSVFVVMTGLYLYLDWQRENTQVTVKVINTRSGETSEYLARQRDLNGRRFKTVDGREITLADTERMEVIGMED